jgi:hypothetical protein
VDDPLEPRSAPEPLTAEEWTRRHARVVMPLAGGGITAVVKLTGVHAFLHPGLVTITVAAVVFLTCLYIVTRRRT